MLNYELNARGSFTPAAVAPQNTINPEQVIRFNQSAQGRMGGTGTVPSLNRTSVFHFLTKNSRQPLFF
jgi:hypothetical protein